MKPRRTLYLVADSGRAAAFLGDGKSVSEIRSFSVENETPRSRDLGADRPGRVAESASARRSAYEPTSDPHREIERSFAKAIAEKLTGEAQSAGADRVVIIAPPVMLGDLRAAYSPALKEKISAEIAKDLTRLPEKELIERLQAIFIA